MCDAKAVSTPLASHFSLSKDQCPQTKEDKSFITKVMYALAIGSFMYVMVYTRPNIGHAMRAVIRFMSNIIKTHLEAMTWILRYL